MHSVDVKQRNLDRLKEQLGDTLTEAAERLRVELPGEDVRHWGHEVGRANQVNGYCTGLMCRGVALSVVVLDLHLFPKVTGRVLGRHGEIYQDALQGDSLDCLEGLPGLLDFYLDLVREPEEDDEVVWHPFFVRPHIEVTGATAEEIDFLSGFLDDFAESRGLHNWVLASTTDTPRKPEAWTSVALPHLREPLPGLRQETLDSLYLQEREATLDQLTEFPQFSLSQRRSELRWSEFYAQFPDATGLFQVSLPGFNPAQTQALVKVNFGFGFPAGAGIPGSWAGAEPEEGPFEELLLLEKAPSWTVVASHDLRRPYPIAIAEELERRRLAPLFESTGTATKLGVNGVKLERVWLDRDTPVRFDLALIQGAQNTSLAVATDHGVHALSMKPPCVIDRPILFVKNENPETIWEPLADFIEQLDP